jgi:LPS export ABC transporter protein LptC
MRFKAKALIAVIVTGLILGGCDGEVSEEIAGHPSELPDEVITKFVTEESDNGLVRWRLSAPRADRFNAKKQFMLDKPTIEFFDKLGNRQSTLTSDAGEFFEGSQYMLAYGNVVVVTVEGDVLETDSLRYLVEEDRIVNDCFNKLTRGNDVVTGYGLDCDHNLSSVDIKRDVEARFIDDEQGLISDEGTADGE